MIAIVYFIISIVVVIIGYNYACIQYKKRDNYLKHYSFNAWLDYKDYDLILPLSFFFWPIFVIIGILYYPFEGIVYLICYLGETFRKIHKIE